MGTPAGATGRANTSEAAARPIHLGNAGLVLLNPFLPVFFERIGVLSADGATLSEAPGAASKAVHLLQWVVDGRLDRPAAELVLNKRLCGLDPAAAIEPRIEAGASDIALCEQMLAAVIRAWTSLGKISTPALQESFLQREGLLERKERGWTLTAQRKTIDVLVDRIPWSIAIVQHRWMRDPLHVRW